MADISKIANLENGLEVRDKLNSVIDRANEVPAKIDKITTAQPGNVAVWGEDGVLLDGGTTPGGGENINVPKWEDVRYETLIEDYLIQYNGRLFTSKISYNLNNIPPLEGENDYWVETSESVANGTPLYAPGTYLVELAEVFKLNTSDNKYYKYLLRQPVPYISSDFDTELLAGHWQILGSESGSSGSSWLSMVVDSAIITEFVALPWTIYLVNCTTAPVLAKMPDVIIGNIDEFKFILQKDTHKLTITTAGGTQTICDDTSQIIATIGGGMQFKANGSDHYCLVEDTRILTRVIEITEDRDFLTDGFENHIIYIVKPNGGQINLNIPAAFVLPGSIAIQSRFQLEGAGSFAITAASGLIGDAQTQVVSTDGDGFDITWSDLKYYVTNDTRPKVASSSITTYSLSELTAITDPITGTFFRKRAASTEDPDFNQITATELSVVVTANPTDPWQVVGSSIIQGAIIGIVPTGNTDIFFNVRRTGLDINTYVSYYKRTALGVETLISQSVPGLVNSTTQQQLRLTAQHAEFSMTETDYYIVRTYARKVTTGSNPTFIAIVEGVNPTRSTLELPAASIAHNTLAGRGGANAHPGSAISIDASGFNGNLTTSDDTAQKVAQKFDDYVIATDDIPTKDSLKAVQSGGVFASISMQTGVYSTELTFDKPSERIVQLSQLDIVEFTLAGTGNTPGFMKLIEIDAHGTYPIYFSSSYTVINGVIVQGKRNYIMFLCNSVGSALVSINQGAQFIFDIASIPGNVLYLTSFNTDTCLESTDNTWADLSPLASVYSTVGGVKKPDYDPVNKKWIWDGTHQFLKTSTAPTVSTSNMTFFAVFNRKTTGDAQLLDGINGVTAGFYLMFRGTSLYFQIGSAANFNNAYGINELYNQKIIFRMMPNINRGIDIFKNGVFISASTAGLNGTGSIGLIGTSDETALTKTWNGDVYSILAFNRILSAAEISKVEQSLNAIFNVF